MQWQPQKYSDVSLGMLTGDSETEQTGLLLPDLYLYNWSHQFVLDGRTCVQSVFSEGLAEPSNFNKRQQASSCRCWELEWLYWGGNMDKG